MVLDSRIKLVKDFHQVRTLDDWRRISPGDIIQIEGVGQVTLDHVRLYLAGQGETLRDDRTPEHWQQRLGHIKLGAQLHDQDRAIVCPFTILIDSAEQHPFTFHGLRADAKQQHRPFWVPVEVRSLGRHPDGMGDYSIDGFVGRVHVERKSVADFQGTILGFGESRERFEQELHNLSQVDAACVVIEGSYQDALRCNRGTKSAKVQSKILNRSTVALQQDYGVSFMFCGSRRLAEQFTFRFLERFHRKDTERRQSTEKLLTTI